MELKSWDKFMKIDTYKINPKLNLKILGNETWLEPMLKELDSDILSPKITLTGEVDFNSDSAGFVYCKGRLHFKSSIICPDCKKETPRPFEINADITWRPAFESHVPKDTQLTASDLDTYFIENDKVDFGQYIYDTILCDLPMNTDESQCESCRSNSSNNPASKLNSKEDDGKSSPFSKLADLIAKKS
jgi:uncharacterized metal-binding protein YceD (DUF177 family)